MMYKLASMLLLLTLLIDVCFADITSLTIAQSTLSAITNGNCLHYKIPTRFCIWASPSSGKNVTPVLDHYLPDLVVAVFRNNDENPWTEVKVLIDKIVASAQESFIPNVGSGDHHLLNESDHQVIFKEADVIGNPALLVLPQKLLLLKSAAKPMRPYFLSMADSVLWRSFMPEALAEDTAAIALGPLHSVGKGLTDWGSIYPHDGTIIGTDDAKASMVIAQRATDLLTNEKNKTFGHVYQKLSTKCGEHCKASPIKENSNETLFQMVYPLKENTCVVFGADNSYKESMLNEKGAYVWVVWRHYQGCEDGDGKYIGTTP